MAMKVTYTVVNGEVLSENRGGTKRDYLPDPLGSTVALLDNAQTQTDIFSYWPYGENNARTGTTATPFQFVGTLGYRRDSSSRTYVRARTLRTDQGRWLTEDPMGRPRVGADYVYCINSPTSYFDPLGLQPSPRAADPCKGYRGGGEPCFDQLCKCLKKNDDDFVICLAGKSVLLSVTVAGCLKGCGTVCATTGPFCLICIGLCCIGIAVELCLVLGCLLDANQGRNACYDAYKNCTGLSHSRR